MSGAWERDWSRWGAAVAHPVRVQILERLDRRVASPSALAGQLQLPVGIVAYHVRRLVELGWLRLVSQEARRGSVEHFYTAAALPAWDQVRWPWDRVLHELDGAAAATVLERLELVAIALTRLLNAAAWALSVLDRDTMQLRTVRGIDSTLNLVSGRRVERQASDDSYALGDFSATARALAERGGFVAFRGRPTMTRPSAPSSPSWAMTPCWRRARPPRASRICWRSTPTRRHRASLTRFCSRGC